MSFNNLKLLAKSIPISIVVVATPVNAGGLEEIVVTAQKREQNLQDVGVSVTAFTAAQVDKFGFTNSTDIISQTPNLSLGTPTGEGNNASLTMRGVGLSDFNDNNEGPVAVYVDDVYVSALSGVTFQLFDVERIEVLRGPQGTLYGRNTTGGLAHFVSVKPSEETEGYISLTAADNAQFKFEGAIGGSLADNVQARFSYTQNQHDGYVDNRGPGSNDGNNTDNSAGRLQLAIQPSDNLDIAINFHASKNDADASNWQHESTYSPDGGITSLALPSNLDFYGTCPGCDAFGYVDNDGNPFAGDYDRDGKLRVDNTGGSVKFDWDIGDMTLTSITAFEKFGRFYEEDTDVSPAPTIHNTYSSDIDQFTQEIRLAGDADRMHWVTGLYYYDQEVDADFQIDASGIGFIVGDASYVQDTESLSLFGQVEYDLSDSWTVIGGLRYTTEERELDYLSVDNGGLLPPAANTMFDYNKTIDNDTVTGKLELDWRVTDSSMIYSSISKGTKSAGFNTGLLDDTGLFGTTIRSDVPYDEEKLLSYEVGVKIDDLFGGTSRFNASVFYYDYTDFQAFAFVNLNQVIFNTDATISGMELEFFSKPFEGLDLMLGAAWLDAEANDIPLNNGSGITRDRTMTLAPEFSVNGLARYQWPALSGNLAVQADFSYQTETFFDIQNHPVSKQGSYSIWNAKISYTDASDKWSVTAFVNNMFDEEYRAYTFDVTNLFGFNQVGYGRPRWAGVTLNYNF